MSFFIKKFTDKEVTVHELHEMLSLRCSDGDVMADVADEDMLLQCLFHEDVKDVQVSPNTNSVAHTQWLVDVFEIMETLRVVCLVLMQEHTKKSAERAAAGRAFREDLDSGDAGVPALGLLRAQAQAGFAIRS